MGQLTKNEVFALAVQRYSDAVYRAAVHNCRCTADAHAGALVQGQQLLNIPIVSFWRRKSTTTPQK